jgi:hypothetical protein
MTPTPSSSPIVPTMTFITSTSDPANAANYLFSNVSIGGPGLIVVVVGCEGANGALSAFNSIQIGGVNATIAVVDNKLAGGTQDGSIAIAYRRITSGTTANIQVNLSRVQQRCAIGVWRIQNNISDTPITTDKVFSTASTIMSTILSSLLNGDFAISVSMDCLARNITWTNATQRFEQFPENLSWIEGADHTKSGNGNLTTTVSVPTAPTQGFYLLSAAWR